MGTPSCCSVGGVSPATVDAPAGWATVAAGCWAACPAGVVGAAAAGAPAGWTGAGRVGAGAVSAGGAVVRPTGCGGTPGGGGGSVCGRVWALADADVAT